MSKCWYVVQSKPKHELNVVNNLEGKSFVCYLPQFTTSKTHRGRIVKTIEPLFPSYLFVRFDIKRDRWREIGRTKGVTMLMGATETYAPPLPKGFVEELIKTEDEKGYLTLHKMDKTLRKFIPGDVLKINEGIYKDFSGTCLRVQNNYVVLLLTLLSGRFELKLPIELVTNT